MTTIPYGKKAYAIRDERHDFFHDEAISFVELDSEVNVNDKVRYYIFKSTERNLVQTLTEDQFGWA